LLLLASLEKKSTYGELDCFLGAGNSILEGDDLADEATKNTFALFRAAMTLPAEKTLPCF